MDKHTHTYTHPCVGFYFGHQTTLSQVFAVFFPVSMFFFFSSISKDSVPNPRCWCFYRAHMHTHTHMVIKPWLTHMLAQAGSQGGADGEPGPMSRFELLLSFTNGDSHIDMLRERFQTDVRSTFYISGSNMFIYMCVLSLFKGRKVFWLWNALLSHLSTHLKLQVESAILFQYTFSEIQLVSHHGLLAVLCLLRKRNLVLTYSTGSDRATQHCFSQSAAGVIHAYAWPVFYLFDVCWLRCVFSFGCWFQI